MASPAGYINVQARGFESLAVDHAKLRFHAPLADRASNPAGFEFWWKMMEFVFALPGPETFPPFASPPKTKEREILDRFVQCAEELAESSLLSADDSLTVHVPDNEGEDERVETNFTSKELVRGFIVLFRQVNSTEKRDPG